MPLKIGKSRPHATVVQIFLQYTVKIRNGNKTEWSTIQGVNGRVISNWTLKHVAQGQFDHINNKL